MIRRMSTLPWLHFMKVTEKAPILEDPYLEFCNSVWPLLYTVGKVFESEKPSQKTPKYENSQKYPKNENLWPICDFSFMVPTNFTFVFVNVVTVTCEYRLEFTTVVTATCKYVLYMPKMDVFQILASLGGYATDSFSCNYFVFDPISSEAYK